jgi:hypothetical protein
MTTVQQCAFPNVLNLLLNVTLLLSLTVDQSLSGHMDIQNQHAISFHIIIIIIIIIIIN